MHCTAGQGRAVQSSAFQRGLLIRKSELTESKGSTAAQRIARHGKASHGRALHSIVIQRGLLILTSELSGLRLLRLIWQL